MIVSSGIEPPFNAESPRHEPYNHISSSRCTTTDDKRLHSSQKQLLASSRESELHAHTCVYTTSVQVR